MPKIKNKGNKIRQRGDSRSRGQKGGKGRRSLDDTDRETTAQRKNWENMNSDQRPDDYGQFE